ncbi:MAG: alkaline phosphatase family protein [Acidobacteriota bacterium]
MRKIALLLLIVLAALATIFIRIQPRGQATIFRRGDRLTLRAQRIYIRPLAYHSRCRAPIAGGGLTLDTNDEGVSATGDEFPVRVRFTYQLPAAVPRNWQPNDWCMALDGEVGGTIHRWAAGESADALLDRRAAGDRAAAVIAREVAAVRPANVSVRIELPPGFERLRAVEDVAAHARRTRPVIFIGLDGADWELLDTYMQSGAMPVLKRLVAEGAGGVLETEHPPLSPILWTTMMTGAGPLEHEILDFTRFNPVTHEKEPITSDERRAPSIWNMATAGGKQTAVFGLWATYAAEPVHGINVTDRLANFLYTDAQKPAGVVYPPSRQSWAEAMVDEAERSVTAERLRRYLPSLTDAEVGALAKVENPYAQPDAALRRILVETEIYRRLSSDYLAGRRALPDLSIIYLQGTDTIGHVFAPFAPPKQPEVSQADYERFHAVPERYFREVDALLGEYVAIATRHGAVLLIASDHGFRWREGRPTSISSTATATAAKWHRNEGIYLLWGPGIQPMPNHLLRGGVRQVCATLLALAGLPAAANTTAPLAPAIASPTSIDYRRHFTSAAPPPAPASNQASSEEIAKLRALGYIGSTESTRPATATGETKTAGAYNNEGLILRQQHRIDDALRAFARARAIDPRYASAMWNESETLFDAGRDVDRADALLIEAMKSGLSDGVKFVIARSIAYNRSGRAARALALIDASVSAFPDDPELRLFRGRYRMDRHDCAGALEDFRAVTRARPNDALAWASTGFAQMCVGDADGGRESLARAHQLDPRIPLP